MKTHYLTMVAIVLLMPSCAAMRLTLVHWWAYMSLLMRETSGWWSQEQAIEDTRTALY